ncbi:hypothetical protein GCM10018962_26440 [Dactylosporangium matsuzakiense]|uniref:Uncharacterized protein n=2 Tax=Dactylosporangium matsuzakiense TaxID=53360 RepID=A0A9W6NP09_9ACTN|nr:hypothetical protein GCM10017581_063020 [Dactylosporangium matsuzakiense]
MITWLARLNDTGVTHTYRRQSEANAALAADLRQAKWVRVFASRGNELTRDSFVELWNRRAGTVRVKILLPDALSAPDSWLFQREQEVGEHDLAFRAGLLGRQVQANLDYLRAHVGDRPEVEVRLYDFPHLARIIATDRIAYLTVYSAREHGRNSPCVVFQNPSPMYDFCLRIFDLAWSRASAADLAQDS